jgi:hypothetical protein
MDACVFRLWRVISISAMDCFDHGGERKGQAQGKLFDVTRHLERF